MGNCSQARAAEANMDKVILVIILFFTFLQHALGKGFLTVTLVQFDNNDGKTWTGNCCDAVSSGSTCYPDECDTYFDICLQDTAFLAAGGCGFGQVTTGVIQNDDHINFRNDIEGTVNPINFAFENWKGAVLKIEAIDDDIQEGRDSADDKIDNVQLLIVGTPDPNGVQKNVIRQSLQGNIIRMQIEYNIVCQPNYYDDCSVYCQPVSDHYDCNDNGARICYADLSKMECTWSRDGAESKKKLDCDNYLYIFNVSVDYNQLNLGWTGDDCNINIDDCLTHTCQHEATCEDIVNGFICMCPAGYTGYLCELAIPSTTRKITFPTPSTPTTSITTAIIPTDRNATTLSGKALSTSVAVFTSKISSMKTNISMTTVPVLESTASTSSPFVTSTVIKSTTTSINIHCKVVLVNSSNPGMVHVQDLNANQMDFFQISLLQRLQNITGLHANQLEIHVLNKVQNQNGNDGAELQENNENSNTGLILGAVIGSLSGLAALCGLLFILVKRMKERQNKVSPSYTVEKKIDHGKESANTLKPKTKDNTADISRKVGDGVSLEMFLTDNLAAYNTVRKDCNIAGTELSIGIIATRIHQKESNSVVNSIIHIRSNPSNNSIETSDSANIPSKTTDTKLNERETSNKISNYDTKPIKLT